MWIPELHAIQGRPFKLLQTAYLTKSYNNSLATRPSESSTTARSRATSGPSSTAPWRSTATDRLPSATAKRRPITKAIASTMLRRTKEVSKIFFQPWLYFQICGQIDISKRRQTLVREGAAVVAQLVEWLLPIPEVCGLNPVVNKNLYWTFTVNWIWKDKNREKEARNGPVIWDLMDEMNSWKRHTWSIGRDAKPVPSLDISVSFMLLESELQTSQLLVES